jgi:hypothetical protein
MTRMITSALLSLAASAVMLAVMFGALYGIGLLFKIMF